MDKVKFYVQRVDKNGNTIPGHDHVFDFDEMGIYYKEAKGINKIGKAKNIYTESYADSEKLRVYNPSENGEENFYEATEVELTILFIGKDRQRKYDQFTNYMLEGYHKFWDTLRNKELFFFVKEAVEPSKETFKDGTPYMQVTYKLQNMRGKCENHVETKNILENENN